MFIQHSQLRYLIQSWLLQPKFWFISSIWATVILIIAAALSGLLYVLDVGYPDVDIIHVAVIVGISLLQVILSVHAHLTCPFRQFKLIYLLQWTSWRIAKRELQREIAEDMENNDIEEGTAEELVTKEEQQKSPNSQGGSPSIRPYGSSSGSSGVAAE